MATKGSCLCGAIQVEVSGKPVGACLCHCLDCRKTSGSTHATNLMVPATLLKMVKGMPTTYTSTANSGNYVTSYFCKDCGTTLWKEGKGAPEMKFIKAGIIDDSETIHIWKPSVELFISRKVVWLPAVDGSLQKEEM